MDQTNARTHSALLASLLKREQFAMADFLVSLAEFDRQRGWEQLGHVSLWNYLHGELGLSRAAAFQRREAVRILRRHPEVEAPLRDGRLCLSSVAQLARVLTKANAAEMVPRFFHMSAREAKAVVAELVPRVNIPERVVVTSLSSPSSVRTSELAAAGNPDAGAPVGTVESVPGAGAPGTDLGPTEARGGDAASPCAAEWPLTGASSGQTPAPELGAGAAGVTAHPAASPASTASHIPGTTFDPLDADLRRLHVTVSRRFLEKLGEARDGMARTGRGVDVEAVLEHGLDLLLAEQARRRGFVRRPRKRGPAESGPVRVASRRQDDTGLAQGAAPEPGPAEDGQVSTALGSPQAEGAPTAQGTPSSYVPAEVRRAVWHRDGARCQWPMAGGGICGSRRRLQLDHIIPRARGGPSTVENVRVLCAFHNDLAARRVFGEAWMASVKGSADSGVDPGPP